VRRGRVKGNARRRRRSERRVLKAFRDSHIRTLRRWRWGSGRSCGSRFPGRCPRLRPVCPDGAEEGYGGSGARGEGRGSGVDALPVRTSGRALRAGWGEAWWDWEGWGGGSEGVVCPERLLYIPWAGMNGASAARLWMTLKAEQSMGLKSVPWRLRAAASSPRPSVVPNAPARPSVAGPAGRVAPRPMAAPPAPRGPVAPPPAAVPLVPAAARPRMAVPVHPMSNVQGNMEDKITGPLLSLPQRKEALETLDNEQVKGCRKCRLCETRTQTVFGEGAADAQLFFIGEGPGETEDQTGRPFVGRAGQLLEKMIIAMGLSRQQVFIGNVVKCRPPGNRTPQADEVAACTPYLVRQIEIIRPKVIVTLGLPATQYMLQTDKPMRALRGSWQEWRGIQLMPTYHPSYVLRSYTPEVRGAVWSDLQKVMDALGLPQKGKSM
jgi:uracil-DNA glycosylase